ncbi:MAG: gamma-glutamyl-gamma-aminobutyrate hydrolase family protein, partial [Gemmataceae bacterium]
MPAKSPVTPPRPRIGITTDLITAKNQPASAKLALGYIDSILTAGGLPVLIPPLRKDSYDQLETVLSEINGIIFTGGADLDPLKW